MNEAGPPPVGSTGGSLRARMLLSAVTVLTLFLGIMGLVLDNANRLTAEQRVVERLQLQIYAFLAATQERTEGDSFTLELPRDMQEPLFNRPGSGRHGLVFLESTVEIWRSQSAVDLILVDEDRDMLLQDISQGDPKFGRLPPGEDREAMFFMTFPVVWNFGSSFAAFQFVVLEDVTAFENELKAFRFHLWGWLIGGAFVLIGIQAAIMLWGLRPIGQLESDLQSIEKGATSYLTGEYPREISGVTGHFNQLLATERQQREQYRTTLADLAHSLKTPLAILKTEAAGIEQGSSGSLGEQVDRMDEIISYQLERAVTSASVLNRSQIEVKPVIEKLKSALLRVYGGRELSIETLVADASFLGDERDLMEMCGNLMDNACKYGRQRVRVVVENGEGLEITVEDDGDGIDESQRDQVLQRGARLDTRAPGQGIGLAVVAEIVARYQGSIYIGVSSLGGARVTVQFSG